MGCCNLKKQKKKMSKRDYLIGKVLFYAIHSLFIIALFLSRIFNKKYRGVYPFYLSYFKDIKKEI